MAPGVTLSVVVPAHDEAANLARLLEELKGLIVDRNAGHHILNYMPWPNWDARQVKRSGMAVKLGIQAS